MDEAVLFKGIERLTQCGPTHFVALAEDLLALEGTSRGVGPIKNLLAKVTVDRVVLAHDGPQVDGLYIQVDCYPL